MEPERELTIPKINMRGYARLLRSNVNFRRLWAAQIVSEIGDWFYTLSIYTLLLQLTGQASSVGVALMLQVLPQTFIGPAAGVVNDRIRRKRVMITADLIRMVIVLAMLLVRSRSMVWLVYPLLLLETIMAAFFEPARSSVIPNITTREDLVLANTLSSTTWSMNLVLGAALGGLIAALLGRDAVFVINAASFLISALFIQGMRFQEPHAEKAEPLRLADLIDLSPITEGIRYVRRDARLLATIFVKAGMLVIGPSWVVFTVMGQRDFALRWVGLTPQRGAMLGMSLLMAARGLGALLGPLLAAPWAGRDDRKLRLGILAGFFAEALGYAVLALTGKLWLACLCITFAHLGGSTVWVFSTTLLQLNTDDRFRGRVFAADLGFTMLTIAIGAFLAGRFVDWGVPAKTVASMSGLLMLVPALTWAWLMRNWKQQPATSSLQIDD
jgi:MFS family permease